MSFNRPTTWKTSPRSRKNYKRNHQYQHIGRRYRFHQNPKNPCSRPVPFSRDKDHWIEIAQQRQSPGLLKRKPQNKVRRTVSAKRTILSGQYYPAHPWVGGRCGTKDFSFIITDLRTRRLAGLKKETFEEVLKTAGIPCRYYCLRSFATLNVLLRSEELATKLAGSKVSMKYLWLPTEYKGKRRIRMTVSNVPIELNGDVLALLLQCIRQRWGQEATLLGLQNPAHIRRPPTTTAATTKPATQP